MKHYLFLVLAVAFEVAAVVLVKESNALTILMPAIGGFLSYGLSFVFAGLASKKLDVGFVYATWSSMAMIMVFFIGYMFYGDVMNLLKALSGIMIVAGVIGFSLAGAKH